jgi:hypothetical protein
MKLKGAFDGSPLSHEIIYPYNHKVSKAKIEKIFQLDWKKIVCERERESCLRIYLRELFRVRVRVV